MIRILAVLCTAALCGGCVTYHYPVPEAGTAVQGESAGDYNYYPEYEPAPMSSSVTYVGATYYPYWSMDYFYLGYGYGRTSVSIGFGGWSPWYSWYPPRYYGGWAWGYPAYPVFYPAFYPVYRPWSGRYWASNDYYWRHKWRRHEHRPRPDPYPGRYADRGRPGGPPGHGAPGRDDHAPRRPQDPGRRVPGEYSDNDRGRQVVPVSGGREWRSGQRTVAGEPSMTVRSGGDAKPGRSRTHPVSSSPGRLTRSSPGTVPVTSSPPKASITEPVRRNAGTVRSREGAKPGPSRTQPINRQSPGNRQVITRSSPGSSRGVTRTPPPVSVANLGTPRKVKSNAPVSRTQPVRRAQAPTRVSAPPPRRQVNVSSPRAPRSAPSRQVRDNRGSGRSIKSSGARIDTDRD